ncbi:MAG: DUF2480 family protein [Leeuwenhoekiella sp.]
MDEIINRVANSKLITFNLEELYPSGSRIQIDVSQWLYEGIILKEKDFREQLKQYDWQQFKDCYIALYCSTDAILPSWAYMLITTYLTPWCKLIVTGTITDLDNQLFFKILNELNIEKYSDQYVIIKGCSNKPIPENVYLQLLQKLQPVVKNLMFGEACSSVPLFKNN